MKTSPEYAAAYAALVRDEDDEILMPEEVLELAHIHGLSAGEIERLLIDAEGPCGSPT